MRERKTRKNELKEAEIGKEKAKKQFRSITPY